MTVFVYILPSPGSETIKEPHSDTPDTLLSCTEQNKTACSVRMSLTMATVVSTCGPSSWCCHLTFRCQMICLCLCDPSRSAWPARHTGDRNIRHRHFHFLNMIHKETQGLCHQTDTRPLERFHLLALRKEVRNLLSVKMSFFTFRLQPESLSCLQPCCSMTNEATEEQKTTPC